MAFVDTLKNMFKKPGTGVATYGDVSSENADSVQMGSNMSVMDDRGFAESRLANVVLGTNPDGAIATPVPEGMVRVPLLGDKPIAWCQKWLGIAFAVFLIGLLALAADTVYRTNLAAQQVGATGRALEQSQRLAKAVSQALLGSAAAFPEVRESADVLAQNVRALRSGDAAIAVSAVPAAETPLAEAAMPLMERAEKNAGTVMGQQRILTQVGASLRAINRQSSDLLEIAETVSSLKLQQNASAAELSASGQLVMLTQRIGKSANEFLTMEGVSPEAVFLLGKDLDSFKGIAASLKDGSPELRLPQTRDAQTKERLEALLKMYEDTRGQARAILDNLQGLVSAREAQSSIIADSEPLRKQLGDLQSALSDDAGVGALRALLMALAGVLAIASAAGFAFVQLADSRQRQGKAELQQLDAERAQQETKRVNDANQAAILRLMNELQTVAEGDLTQEATVTEDITGAIADSVNYTVEELRSLVGNVQNAATRVAQTTAKVESTSTELLAASTEQLREIRGTGQSVLEMAGRISGVSGKAQESAQVARQSLEAAQLGQQAVQDAIGGMNSIRDQIQETSKRIKRLGESSQEIGEITELISDITEQTNVLALNAAIQAASAGEAGRGFSVVAEEVQRLAERSADATKQIAALVKAIQTDTQDAVGAMERSTQGVVQGAKLSDKAGTALTEIDSVTRRLAELIESISSATSAEAVSANEVASNIQHIFAVTEQTGEGTRSTAQQVRDLSRIAEELRQSVSRFKIA